MESPLISIILPTYNGEKYLGSAIESCLNQTYKNIELIIIDDASTDNTSNIIMDYYKSDKRVKYIRNEVNSKLPKSLNSGFLLAKGEYLTWTSDDNMYKSDSIQEMLNVLLNNNSIDFVYANYTVIDEKGNPIKKIEVGRPNELLKHNCIGACFLYRRKVYEIIGNFCEDLFLVEDYDYWLMVNDKFNMHKLDKDLYFYRYHSNSLSEKKKDLIDLAIINLLRKSLHNLQNLKRIDRASIYLRLSKLHNSKRHRFLALFNLILSIVFNIKCVIRKEPYVLMCSIILGHDLFKGDEK